MIAQRPSTIEEAPSLSDITSATGRVGKVDFTSTLVDIDRTGPDDETDRVVPGTPALPGTLTDEAEVAGDPLLPSILPPARVDATMAVEAERTRAEVVAARGERTGRDEVVVATATTATPGRAEAPSGPPEGLLIEGVADFAEEHARRAAELAAQAARAEAVHAEAARLEAERTAQAALDEAARREAEQTAQDALVEARRVEIRDAAARLEASVEEEPLLAPVEHDVAPRPDVADVADIADSVIAAMRSINEAHERHVEALELETARRCELLTAQAELDAELIRLHARREAHAIISAARERSGEHDAGLVEADQMGEIGETFSRFAETIETTVTTGPESPDPFGKS